MVEKRSIDLFHFVLDNRNESLPLNGQYVGKADGGTVFQQRNLRAMDNCVSNHKL